MLDEKGYEMKNNIWTSKIECSLIGATKKNYICTSKVSFYIREDMGGDMGEGEDMGGMRGGYGGDMGEGGECGGGIWGGYGWLGLAGWLAGWPVGWVWLAGWLAGCLAGWLAGHYMRIYVHKHAYIHK